MPELVVAPSIVMASPMFGMANESPKLMRIRMNVTMAFYFVLNFWSGFKNSSSIVSLHGRIVRGVAKRMTVRIPNRDM